MNAVDYSKADQGLLDILHLFELLRNEQKQNRQLKREVTSYRKQNSQYKKAVDELTAQINALKNIDESIFAREVGIGQSGTE